MKVKAIVFIALTVLFGLCATPAIAQTPALPHSFYGTVEVNNQPAEIGTQIEAIGEGVLTNVEGNPVVVTEVGYYGGANPLEPKLIVQGDIADGTTLTFYVNGIPADQTASWYAGTVTELDLTVTMSLVSPTVSTDVATGIENTAATLHGVLSNLGNTSPVTVSFEWGTTTDYGNETDAQPMTSLGSFNITLSGLDPNTSYHFRAKAVGEGTSYGIDGTFTTTAGESNSGDGGIIPLTVSNISISPSKVNIGETVTISVLVTNSGDATSNRELTLEINGVAEESREVTLEANANQSVNFTVSREEAGSYSVAVDSLSGSFSVTTPGETTEPNSEIEKPINWPVLGGVIAAVVIVFSLIIVYRTRSRRYY